MPAAATANGAASELRAACGTALFSNSQPVSISSDNGWGTTARIPQTVFTVTSEHVRFYFLVFFSVLQFLVVGSVR